MATRPRTTLAPPHPWLPGLCRAFLLGVFAHGLVLNPSGRWTPVPVSLRRGVGRDGGRRRRRAAGHGGDARCRGRGDRRRGGRVLPPR